MICVKYRSVLPVLMLFLAVLVFLPDSAAAQCRLCAAQTDSASSSGSPGATEIPLRIEITANLDFSRLALLNRTGGEVELDPDSRQRRFSGGLTDLGGLSLHGEGRLTGEPGRLVRVQLPERITLSAPNGSTADLVKLDTDLPAQARLDRDGRLTFSFGGKLRVTGSASGQFRGRIAITATYE
ncbi:hypothetical protein GCM10009096_17460 [Parasphingorhabdus litoris]|uniref:DUF4402 domain-containing protein n=1 Tax=Parasphingorhabdus litoris TaxID=394733 RepID=A0ABP3KC95_9SPHN|nr:DUF4402 domain-containing protein [Parasphingorhabdus litoris]